MLMQIRHLAGFATPWKLSTILLQEASATGAAILRSRNRGSFETLCGVARQTSAPEIGTSLDGNSVAGPFEQISSKYIYWKSDDVGDSRKVLVQGEQCGAVFESDRGDQGIGGCHGNAFRPGRPKNVGSLSIS